ncbi:hypothetical protein [Novosphingobium sp. BL-8A]
MAVTRVEALEASIGIGLQESRKGLRIPMIPVACSNLIPATIPI